MTAALVLQMVASAFALAGAFLLRKPGAAAPWGFVTWLVSNPAAMAFMALQGHWAFFAQHLVFLFLAAESVWFWLVVPRRRQSQRRAMKITLESTTKIVHVAGDDGRSIPARIWEGHTDSGIPVHCYVTRIAVADDQPQEQFLQELQQHRAPSAAVEAIPLRLVL